MVGLFPELDLSQFTVVPAVPHDAVRARRGAGQVSGLRGAGDGRKRGFNIRFGTARGEFANALAKEFGSIEAFRAKFSDTAAKHFASGWVALALTRATKKLVIVELKDHEVVRAADATVIFILDVWEHAYYVKYQNRRPEFITAFWNIVDWENAEEKFSRFNADSGV